MSFVGWRFMLVIQAYYCKHLEALLTPAQSRGRATPNFTSHFLDWQLAWGNFRAESRY